MGTSFKNNQEDSREETDIIDDDGDDNNFGDNRDSHDLFPRHI